jgi:hypothetical protein
LPIFGPQGRLQRGHSKLFQRLLVQQELARQREQEQAQEQAQEREREQGAELAGRSVL